MSWFYRFFGKKNEEDIVYLKKASLDIQEGHFKLTSGCATVGYLNVATGPATLVGAVTVSGQLAPAYINVTTGPATIAGQTKMAYATVTNTATVWGTLGVHTSPLRLLLNSSLGIFWGTYGDAYTTGINNAATGSLFLDTTWGSVSVKIAYASTGWSTLQHN